MAPKVARGMVDATQLAPKVRAEDIARARQAGQVAEKPKSFWQRLFGGKGK